LVKGLKRCRSLSSKRVKNKRRRRKEGKPTVKIQQKKRNDAEKCENVAADFY